MTEQTQLNAWLKLQLEDAKAKDILMLDVKDKTSITDTMVICTGTSNRHVKSIASKLVEHAKAKGLMPVGVEGEQSAEWVLVDLGDAIIHVMQQEARDFYQLEELWTK